MARDEWRRVKDVLAAALELRPEARAAYLDEACAADPSLRLEVDSLLAADHDAGTFIESPLLSDAEVLDDDALDLGRQVGAYVIERRIGRGGMGSVYLARRTDQEFERQVAIKMIRRGMDSELLVRRFRHERQILASLDHPHIARLFDGGTSDDGLPYFVMEYVDGVALDRYADAQCLNTPDRLRLCLRVVDAVQHAHERQIVHRDLKPSNVLVTADGQPKLLDFGIAKILDPAVDGASTLTALARPMTPDYASPEQVRGDAVTPATDVYALGLLLYELLTGRRPYRLATHTPDELARVVCEQDPERPSAAIGRSTTVTHGDGRSTTTTPDSVSQTRDGSPEQLRQRLSGALDDIVLKALRKDPRQRYASAAALADDLRRYLDDLPVEARRGALRYRASRFLTRHRVAAAVVALVLASVGLTAAAVSRLRPAAPAAVATAAPEAQPAPRRSAAVLRFRGRNTQPADAWLATALAEMLTTELGGGGQLRVVPADVVTRVERDAGPGGEAAADATLTRLRQALGTDLVIAGVFEVTARGAARAVQLEMRVLGAAEGAVTVTHAGSDADLSALVADAGRALRRRLGVEDNTPEAARAIRAALPQRPLATKLYAEGLERLRALDSVHARDLLERAAVEEPANPLIHMALAAAWVALGYDGRADASATRAFDASSGLNREQRLTVEGQLYEARKDWAKALDVYRTLWGFFSDNGEYGLRLATAQASSGNAKDALVTVEALRRLPAPQNDDPRVDLAESLAASALGDFPRELSAAQQAIRHAERAASPLLTARARLAEGRSYYNQGQPAQAEQSLDQARQGFAAAGDHAGMAGALNSLGTVVDDRGDTARALRLYEESLAAAESVGDRRGMSSALNNLGIVLKDHGRLAEALQTHQRALALRREVGDRNWTAVSLSNIGVVLFEQDRLREATASYEEGLAIAREIGDQRNIARTLHNLAIVQRETGNIAGARAGLEQLIPVRAEIRDRRGGVMARVELGIVLLAQGEIEAARRTQNEAVTQAREVALAEGEAQALYQLGEIALAAGDLAEARGQHEAALALRQKLQQARTVLESQVALAALALEEGRADEAARLVQSALRPQEQAPIRLFAGLVSARARLATHDVAGAVRDTARLRALVAHTERVAPRWALEMVEARVELAQGQPAKARTRLVALRRVLTPNGMVLADLETRLLLAETAVALHDPSARSAAESLASDAGASGAGLVRRRALALIGS